MVVVNIVFWVAPKAVLLVYQEKLIRNETSSIFLYK